MRNQCWRYQELSVLYNLHARIIIISMLMLYKSHLMFCNQHALTEEKNTEPEIWNLLPHQSVLVFTDLHPFVCVETETNPCYRVYASNIFYLFYLIIKEKNSLHSSRYRSGTIMCVID